MNQIVRTPRQLGEVLQRQRRLLGQSQTAVAEKAGMRQALISGIESGSGATGIGRICDLLAALDLELRVVPRSKSSTDEFEDLLG